VSLARLTKNNHFAITRGNEYGQVAINSRFFQIDGCAPSEPRIQSKLGDGVARTNGASELGFAKNPKIALCRLALPRGIEPLFQP
jgi:hypothetical protein